MLDDIRARGDRPRVHGNGFIQLDLTDTQRLHIWGDPRIPRQRTPTMIHDHVFDFMSRAVVGRLINVTYDYVEMEYGDYRVYTPSIREGEDTVLKPTGTYVNLYASSVDMISGNSASDRYDMHRGVFHETIAPDGPAATVISKAGKTQAQGAKDVPRVLCPVHTVPDNDFNRYDADPELLWQIIHDTLRRPR